jgi:hypothetical protein
MSKWWNKKRDEPLTPSSPKQVIVKMEGNEESAVIQLGRIDFHQNCKNCGFGQLLLWTHWSPFHVVCIVLKLFFVFETLYCK